MPSATVKFAKNSPIDTWLEKMRSRGVEQSRAIRCALEAYLAQGGGDSPPPPDPIVPAPAGGIAFDYEKLTDAVYQALMRAAREGIGVMQNVPLNRASGNTESTPTHADALVTENPDATDAAADKFLVAFG